MISTLSHNNLFDKRNEEETRLLEEIRVVQEKITELKLSQITEMYKTILSNFPFEISFFLFLFESANLTLPIISFSVMSQERWNETLTEQVEVDRQGVCLKITVCD